MRPGAVPWWASTVTQKNGAGTVSNAVAFEARWSPRGRGVRRRPPWPTARVFDFAGRVGLLFAAVRDLDVRCALRASILAKHLRDPDTLVLDELGLEEGSARVDIAVVNGSLHGYEIKSDADTLERLPGQVEVYSRVLDFVTLVVGSRHARDALLIIPNWWGVRVAHENDAGELSFRVERRERMNPGLDLPSVAGLLWRDEALAVLEERGRARGLRSKPRRDLYLALADALSARELRRVVRETLRSRTSWRAPAPPA